MPTEHTTVRRLPARARYDRATLDAILDEGLVCHVGFVTGGRPFVIPTTYGRVGDDLYLHGSPASRLLRTLSDGVDVCVTVTLLDGIVLARSAFHHSMNYRSAVLVGRATVVDDLEEKRAALDAFVEHVVPGRAADARPPNEKELRATLVLRLPIADASAKVRTGGPIDDDEDMALAVWAGELPLRTTPGPPVADAGVDVRVPAYVSGYRRGAKA
ncbi:MAG: putative flavin-nucleotide-binding protein [Acidimicrobiales bacterium]|jgi:nitroimidazol reductase NimA-like FMN-containing flavoprotein (pyridoxamine 5'-phosphate oxidase superfamily)|nr:putative flavin-nucleotide-binding protein [Acidimicrobiales bacterium]